MGQNISSPFSNSKEIEDLIINDTWQQILNQNEGHNIVDVYLNSGENLCNPFQHKYIIKLDSVIPSNCTMTIIFPNHPLEKKRLLWTTGSLNTLSHEINRRLQESSRDGLMLIITCGDKFFKFNNIIGTIYLVWAKKINRQTVNKQENGKFEDVPILVEKNGQHGFKNVFIFKGDNDKTTNKTDISLLEPLKVDSIFCCEIDNRKDEIHVIPTLSESTVNQIVNELVVRTIVDLKNEPLPFDDDDGEMLLIPLSGKSINYIISGDPSKPDEE